MSESGELKAKLEEVIVGMGADLSARLLADVRKLSEDPVLMGILDAVEVSLRELSPGIICWTGYRERLRRYIKANF